MSSGGGGGNTVTSIQQIPDFEQQASQQNQDLARAIGSQAYPTYNAPLIQGFTPLQQSGQTAAVNAAGSYQPYLNAATGVVGQAVDPTAVNNASGASAAATGGALSLTDPNAVGAYMNPYVEKALAPQISDLQLQLAQQQRGIDTQATQANAFGDARQGAASALQNYYGDQALNQLVGTGYNNAYSQALQALQGQQGVMLGAGQQFGNLANIGLQEQGVGLSGANALASLGGQAQAQGITGANAVYNAGQQQQQLGQQELNTGYQQFLNQVNWPTQMLNIRESALSNSPYNISSATTLPQGNAVAQGFGGLSSLAGLAGLLGSNSSASSGSPFGNVFAGGGQK